MFKTTFILHRLKINKLYVAEQEEVLHLRRNNPKYQYMLKSTQMENKLSQNELGILLNTNVTIRHQCALPANKVGLHYAKYFKEF